MYLNCAKVFVCCDLLSLRVWVDHKSSPENLRIMYLLEV